MLLPDDRDFENSICRVHEQCATHSASTVLISKWLQTGLTFVLLNQMRKMLIEWLIEGGEQLKLQTRTIFQAVVLHDRFMHKSDRPLDFQNGMDEIDRFMINALSCLLIAAKNCEIDT